MEISAYHNMSLPNVYLGIMYYLIPTKTLATGGYLRDLVQKPGKTQIVPLTLYGKIALILVK